MSDTEKPDGSDQPHLPEFDADPIQADAAGAEEAVAIDDVSDEPPADPAPEPLTAKSEPIMAPRAAMSQAPEAGGALHETVEIVKTIVYALLIALVLRVLFFQPFTIPSASMEPAVYEGDYIVVSKWSYGYSRHSIPWSPPLFKGRILGKAAERGDIAVFKLPRDNQTDYIKRVIGVPGDRVQMINGRLHLNGQAVDNVEVSRGELEDVFGRPVIQIRETLPNGPSYLIQDFGPGGDLDNTQVFEVPIGHYFMMGDNRDNSIDSRVSLASGVGLVPAENLVGKAQVILFSWSPGASLFNPVSWFTKLRPSRFFTVLE